jgi:riboflavin biosynthesis pyrimidine reductase
MVMSPNGYIARKDGDEEWISEVNWTDFVKDAKKCNNIVVGRETYEVVTRMYEDYNFDAVDADYKIIVTNKRDFPVPAGYKVVYSPKEAVDFLNEMGIKEVLLSGGGKINASFAEAGLIDELELIVEPHVIGSGRQVLAVGNYEFHLELKELEKLSHGRVRLLYNVVKENG